VVLKTGAVPPFPACPPNPPLPALALLGCLPTCFLRKVSSEAGASEKKKKMSRGGRDKGHLHSLPPMQCVYNFSPPGLLNLKMCTKASGHCRDKESLGEGGREARPVMLMLMSQPHTPERGVFGPEGLAPVYQVKARERRPEGNMAATSLSV